ncbi:MAG: hypothetical protein P3W93_008450, partial [Thermus sp.]|nr:hypothetical protein [Thermus sp.]
SPVNTDLAHPGPQGEVHPHQQRLPTPLVVLIGWMDKDLQETAPRVRQDLPLSPFDLLRPIVPPGPPFPWF